jgi:hypothetical protein
MSAYIVVILKEILNSYPVIRAKKNHEIMPDSLKEEYVFHCYRKYDFFFFSLTLFFLESINQTI